MGVLSVHYVVSARREYSCVVSWDTSSDHFSEGQWLGGGVEICDVSPDGRYMAYIGTTFHRPVPSYFAISRPPCLTALRFEPIVYTSPCDVYFEDDFSYRSMREPLRGATATDRRKFAAYEKEGSPLLELSWSERDKRRAREIYEVFAPVERYGTAAVELLYEPSRGTEVFPEAAPLLHWFSFTQWDRNGRLIVAQDQRVYAFSEEFPKGELLIDFSDWEFKAVVPPDWALQW